MSGMKGWLWKDWGKFDYTNPEHQRLLFESLRFQVGLRDKFPSQEFTDHKDPEVRKAFLEAHKEIKVALQEFTTTGDFPVSAVAVLEKYHALTNYDNGYEEIFDIRDFAGTTESGFEILDVRSGMTFEYIPIGDKINLKQMRGSKERVFFDYYGGGLNWHMSLFQNQQYWVIEDNAKEFINKAYARRASVHYLLLEAAMNRKTCVHLEDPGCTDCAAYSIALARAMNQVAVTLLTNVQNKGYGTTAGTTLIVLVPLQAMSAVKEAMDVRLQQFGESTKRINFMFKPVHTMMLQNTNRIGIVLPKLKIKSGYKMNLTTYESFDMLSLMKAAAGWMAFGAAVGDLDQIECIDLTPPSGLVGP